MVKSWEGWRLHVPGAFSRQSEIWASAGGKHLLSPPKGLRKPSTWRNRSTPHSRHLKLVIQGKIPTNSNDKVPAKLTNNNTAKGDWLQSQNITRNISQIPTSAIVQGCVYDHEFWHLSVWMSRFRCPDVGINEGNQWGSLFHTKHWELQYQLLR